MVIVDDFEIEVKHFFLFIVFDDFSMEYFGLFKVFIAYFFAVDIVIF